MGLKSGSRDAGLDDSDDDAQADEQSASNLETSETEVETEAEETDTGTAATTEETSPGEGESVTGGQRPTVESLPYKLRRETVNEGREQVPYFLREEVTEGDDELQETLEDTLGETVYKSDYREAAMVVAQRNPELVADVLREWGYDLDTS